jgi:glycosyltransferase involved in cell wall biosynthesis
MAARPPLLFIAPIMPADGGNGLAMRMGVFLEAYARRFAISLVVAPIAGQLAAGGLGASGPTPFVARHAERVVVLSLERALHPLFQLIARHRDPAERRAAMRAYPRPRSFSYDPVLMREAMADRLGVESRFAMVHVGRLYMAPLAEAYFGHARCILDMDDDDARTLQRIGALRAANGDVAGGEDDTADAGKFEALASEYLPRFSLCLVSSEPDKASLESRRPGGTIGVVENAIRPAKTAAADGAIAPIDLLMVGSLGYYPNVDAAMFFCREVLPRLYPANFTILGSRPGPAITVLGRTKGVSIAADVPDVAPYYAASRVVVAPIRAGGGSRIKILEAFAQGRPVVSTRLGAEGLDVADGRHLLLADQADDFAAAARRLLHDPDLAGRLVAAARQLVAEHYDVARIATRIESLADQPGAMIECAGPEAQSQRGHHV